MEGRWIRLLDMGYTTYHLYERNVWRVRIDGLVGPSKSVIIVDGLLEEQQVSVDLMSQLECNKLVLAVLISRCPKKASAIRA